MPGFTGSRSLPEANGGRQPESTASEAVNMFRGRWWILVVIALVAGGVFVQQTTDWNQFFAGKGYVRWRFPKWKALQEARKYEWHVVVARFDEKTFEAFRDRVLADERVQKKKTLLVWFKEEPQPGEEPEVTIRTWESDGVELLLGPFDPRTVTPAEFAGAVQEATTGAKEGDSSAVGLW